MQPLPESHFVFNGTIKLHHLDWGNPEGHCLVMLHGARLHAHVWDQFSHQFKDRFHILALDHRGHGDSGWGPREDYQFENFYQDLRAVVRARGVSHFTLIAHSLGGRVAMLYAQRHPADLAGLVLVDITAGRPPAMENSAVVGTARMRPIHDFDSPEGAIAHVKQRMPQARVHVVEESVRHGIRKTDNGRYIWKYDPEVLSRPRETANAWDFWSIVKTIETPTLLQYGSRSDIVTSDMAARMAATMPFCTVERIEEAGHALFTDQPEAFAAGVERFLMRDPSAR